MLIRVSKSVPAQVLRVNGPVQKAVNSNHTSLVTVGPLDVLHPSASSMPLSVEPIVVKTLSPPKTGIRSTHSSFGTGYWQWQRSRSSSVPGRQTARD